MILKTYLELKMKIYKFIALSTLIAISSAQSFATTNCDINSSRAILNTRDIFGEILLFNIPSDFGVLPGEVSEDRAWYKYNKTSPNGETEQTIEILAYKGEMIPKNANTYLTDIVKNVSSTCRTSYSTFNLEDSSVLGVEGKRAMWKCGESGGWRRKVRSVTVAHEVFEKNGVFYEIKWTKYGQPNTTVLTQGDKQEAIGMLDKITPFGTCKDNLKDPDFYKKCLAQFNR